MIYLYRYKVKPIYLIMRNVLMKTLKDLYEAIYYDLKLKWDYLIYLIKKQFNKDGEK